MAKYTIAYGNRRLLACAKLGWKAIPAYVEGELKEIPLADIECEYNARTKLENIAVLMQSIKDEGLLQPIGLLVRGEQTAPELIMINAVENTQRQDLSPSELGKLCQDLQDKYHLTLEEMAARLGMPRTKLRMAMNVYNAVPASLQKQVGFGNGKRTGKIAPSVIEQVLNRNIPKDAIDELFKALEEGRAKSSNITTITTLVKGGMGVRQAIANSERFVAKVFTLTCDRVIIDGLQAKYDLNINELILQMLQGKIAIPKGLFASVE